MKNIEDSENNVNVRQRATQIEKTETKSIRDSLSSIRSYQERTSRLQSTESTLRKNKEKREGSVLEAQQHKKTKISAKASHEKEQSTVATHAGVVNDDRYHEMLQLGCLYSRYLQYNRLFYNMESRFVIAKTASEDDLKIGYEALKEKENEIRAKNLEEEAKESGIMQYLLKLKEVLKKVDEKQEEDKEIDYEKGLLVDLLLELKDIKIPASSIREDIKILTKYRELIQAIISL